MDQKAFRLAIEKKMQKLAGDFHEEEHPRAENGEFGPKTGEQPAKKDKKPKSKKDVVKKSQDDNKSKIDAIADKVKKPKTIKDQPTSSEANNVFVKRDGLVSKSDLKDFLKNTNGDFDKARSNPELKEATYEWSRAGYQYARKIQKGEKISGDDKQIGQKIVDGFDKHFNELPSYSGPLVRDLQLDIDDALANFKEGANFELDAHSSFTAGESYGRRKVRLVLDKSTSGKAVWGMCENPEEAEVIVPKGQKYKITKVEETDEIPYVRVHIEEI